MTNSIGNLFIISIIIGGFACYLLDIKGYLLGNTFLRRVVKKIMPKTTSKEYKSLNDLLDKASINIGVLELYIVKIAILFAASIFLFLVFITNTQVKQKDIFNTTIYSSYSSSDFRNSSSTRLKNFNIVKRYVDISQVENTSQWLKTVKNVIYKYSDIDSNEINDSAAVTLKDIMSSKQLYAMPRKINYILSAVLFFFLPDIMLKIYSIVIIRRKKDEVYNLINLMVVVGSNDNVTSRSVMRALIDNSHYLKPYLKSFESNYLINREDAYKKFLSDKRYTQVSKIISALRQIEGSNKESAIYNIESKNESIEKTRKLTYENKIEKKDGIALVIFVVGVCMLVKIIMDISAAGISSMSNMNF